MLLPLLEGDLSQNEQIRGWLSAMGWMETDEKQVFVLNQTEEAAVPPQTAARSMELAFPDAFVLLHGTETMLLANYALVGKSKLRQQLKSFLAENRFCAGESSVFREITELKERSEEAAKAAGYAVSEAGRILSFRDVLLPYALSVLREHADRDPEHPALRILTEYDRKHEADLTQTLRVFLRENCSYTAAARTLFIHRSTLIYRMEKITELTRIDLSDPEERFLLQLSLYLADRK